MANDGVRQRNKTGKDVGQSKSVPSKVEGAGRVISILDIFRVIITLIGLGVGGSYYLTSGESLTYDYKPWWLNPKEVQAYLKGPLQLTEAELAQYNGRDPEKPIYLAINGTIFDVSAGRNMYGPGGGYSIFAGADATRAFVTGCFPEDKTTDLRGAEVVYLPIEDYPDEPISAEEKKERAQRERKAAKEKVIAEVQKWYSFYSESPKYPIVGTVVGHPKKFSGPLLPICQHAMKGRPKRSTGKNAWQEAKGA